MQSISDFTYLFVNIAVLTVPLALSFRYRGQFIKKWRAFLPAIGLSALFFLVWDVYFAAEGVWGFTPAYHLNLNLLHLPLEEYLFFFCIPYACLFTYYQLKIRQWQLPDTVAIVMLALFFTFSVFMVMLLWGRLYSTTIGILNAIFVFYLLLRKPAWLKTFYPAYLIVIIPFLLFNGILTGIMTESPVVWYDNSQNMNLRIFTVPAEDFFYYHLLFVLNVFFFERFDR